MGRKSKGPFPCDTCGKIFQNNKRLQLHIRVHTGEKPFNCDICFRSFSQKVHLDIHLKRHKGIKKYKCSTCAFKAVTNGDLQEHLQVHMKNPPSFKCQLCEKTFKYEKTLKVHEKKRCESAGVKSFKCASCKESFSTQADLAAHESEIFHGSHECPFCGKKYCKKNSLNMHLKTHSGANYIQCKFCSYRTPRMSDLVRHEDIKHNAANGIPLLVEKTFKCENCDFTSVTKSELEKHLESHVENPPSFQCHLCEKTFTTKNSLEAHGRIHTINFKCGSCQESFSTRKDLEAHEREFSHFNHVCNTCGKKYLRKRALVHHLISHPTEKIFKCELCPYQTVHRPLIEKHERKHKYGWEIQLSQVSKLRKSSRQQSSSSNEETPSGGEQAHPEAESPQKTQLNVK